MRITLLGTQAMAPDLLRYRAQVRYDDGSAEESWIAVPADLASAEPNGNPWAAAYLPLAMTLGEPLHLDLPVCPELLRHLHQLQSIWRSWYPGLTIVPIEAPLATGGAPAGAGDALFFSGGVDAAHRLAQLAAAGGPAPDLLLAWGSDVPVTRPDVFAELRERYAAVAAHYGARLVPVASNLRTTRWRMTDWGQLSHMAFLMGCGLMLGHRYRTLHVSSSYNPDCRPWGSHPATDPLYSTAGLTVVYEEPDRHRMDKVKALVGHPVLLANLRVCWLTDTGGNCGVCRKCLVTLVSAALAGVLGECRWFPPGSLTVERLARFRIPPSLPPLDHYNEDYLWPMIQEARAQGRHDITEAFEVARQRSARAEVVDRVVASWKERRGIWRLHRAVEARVRSAFGEPQRRSP